jgi:hypothetical protein
MSDNHRRMGLALGALLVPPLLSLLAGPLANADGDVTTYGPYTFDGASDTLNVNYIAFGLDNVLTSDGLDLDTYYSALTNDYGVFLTDPGVFQVGIDDVGGTIGYIDSFTPPFDVDPGLADISSVAVLGSDGLAGLFGL